MLVMGGGEEGVKKRDGEEGIGKRGCGEKGGVGGRAGWKGEGDAGRGGGKKTGFGKRGRGRGGVGVRVKKLFFFRFSTNVTNILTLCSPVVGFSLKLHFEWKK